MNDTQESIILGCKFIWALGSEKWESSLNKRAVERMRDLCQLQLDEWETGVKPEPPATVEDAVKIFGGENENQ
jgi:hypothetical protein